MFHESDFYETIDPADIGIVVNSNKLERRGIKLEADH